MVLLTLVNMLALAQAPSDPCEVTAGHGGYTILLAENGHFVHCRKGQTTEEEPVSHERVVLQLPPEGPEEPYRYRLFDPTHPEAGRRNPLLGSQLGVIQDFAEILHDLANAPETVAETLQHLAPTGEETPAGAAPAETARKGQAPPIAPPGGRDGPEVVAAMAAQAKYLGYATPAFSDAIHALRRTFGKLEQAAGHVDEVCNSSAGRVRAGKLREKTLEICTGGPGARLLTDLVPFKAVLEAYVEARATAREAILDLNLAPTSAVEEAAAAQKALRALLAATGLAKELVADARGTADRVEALLHEAQLLRAAVAIPPSPDGLRLHLGNFSANGIFTAPDIYELRVLRRPSRLLEAEDLTVEGKKSQEQVEEREILVDRFQPAPRNYVDIGLALMYSGGLPDHPTVVGQINRQQLVQAPTTGFNGGVLASLEPFEFTAIADPWAELLHFPTLIIPFTLDPTRNYFIGAGVGILDVASIDVGAHVAFSQIPAPGNFYGQTFASSPVEIGHVTQYGALAAGYFVSLSVDLVGLSHLIVDRLKPKVRDVESGAPPVQK
jgi:hypothetical protein